ncbi:juvenile hormone acid O-methyltransferase [Dermacentor silvarum]|uniref:juvenile hormone acid O-methyltransferase n=1 Tax=Dermacentor silvarum TaxID=543639 RepID=UPI002100F5B1|nr:juvenile hormone acid O-methyltransferase [Dermacentor silvarum]
MDEARTKEESQFLDVGCGSGSFTKKHLLPRLPPSCKRLVAVDNSDAMLKFAGENRADPRIEYRKLDIVADEDVTRFVQAEGHFQRVYSFLAFHWIADHRHALKNVETLLAPGGECFLLFSAGCLTVFDVFMAMMESPRWKKYSNVINQRPQFNVIPLLA